MKAEAIGAMLVAGVVTAGLVRLLRRLLPGKPDPTTLTMDAVRQVYRGSWRVGLFIYGLGAILAVVCTLALWPTLLWLHSVRLSTLPPSRFLIPERPDPVLWLVISACSSCGLGLMIPVLLTPAVFRRDMLERFWRASSALDKFDSRRVLVYMGVFFATVPMVASVFLMGWYYRFDERGVTSNDLLGVGERFRPYEEVARVVQVERYRRSNGNIVIRPYYRIVFRDGSHWTNYDHMLMVDEFVPLTEFAPLIDFVCQKTGKPLEQAEFLENAPGE